MFFKKKEPEMGAPEPMEAVMNKDDVAGMVLEAKKKSGLSWEQIAEKIGMSPVWTHSACVGMNSMPPEKAEMLASLLGLPAETVGVLAECPTKLWDQTVPTDPCIYRLYEIMGVYGETFKTLTQEKFGDGIMSAIDFEMYIDKVEHPKGDRVKVTMSGKFLPYNAW